VLLQRNGWYKLSHDLSSRRRELFRSFFPGRHYPEPPPVLGPGPDQYVLRPALESSQDMPAHLLSSGWEEPRHGSSSMDGAAELGNMANQLELAEQIFLAVLELKPAERGALLEKLCGQNAKLRRRVEDMLADNEHAGSFLEYPPVDFLEEAMVDSSSVAGTTRTIQASMSFSAQNPDGRLKPGQVLNNRYVIVRFIAKGGMGEVYEAEDPYLQNVHVALKTILPHIADEPASQQHFEREVLLAREVTHPNLCPIYEIFHCDQPPDDSFLFLTMKLLPGETLATRLRGSARISTEEGLAILKQMAAGLVAIHAAGVVHRDIKPSNVMLDGAGADVRLWITDFGLARVFEAEATNPSKEVVAGTPGYLAPELSQGQPHSQASDLYAFGVVLHQVFCGQKPAMTEDGSAIVAGSKLNASGAPSYCVDLVKGCLDRDPQRRCEAFEDALVSLGLKRIPRKPWTRRQFMSAAAAGVCSLGIGGWVERDELYKLAHPLPGKRFVALLNWPKTSDSRVAPMLTGVLNAIKSELARAEAFDRNLFVISPEDIHQEVPATAHLRDVCDPLGANLALAAHGVPGAKYFELILRVLDPISGRTLRERRLTCANADIASLPGKAVQAAVRLLNVSHYPQDSRRTEPGTQSTDAFTAFQQAETLVKQPNDGGLDAAIEKYKDAVDLDPRYALAYARLARVYVDLYGYRLEPGLLDLARGNCERALELDSQLVEAQICLARVLYETGNEQAALDQIAKVLERHPSDPEALVCQGEFYSQSGRWSDAENTYQRAVKERPNFWVNYNQLGFIYHKEGKFPEAIRAFRVASAAAPANAMSLSNLGLEYMQTGDLAAATECLRKSLALAPDSAPVLTIMSIVLRYQGKYADALPYALKAVQVNPGFDENWLELGECYASMRNRQNEAKSAYLRAAKEAERRLQTNPNQGPLWMLLALYRVKSGSPNDALALIQKAESLGAADMDSQLYKARILELLGRRGEALNTFKVCFEKGATASEVDLFPDMQALRRDARYHEIAKSKSSKAEAGHLSHLHEARNV
jgi:tetratricopeptide (TPR) repeat protein